MRDVLAVAVLVLAFVLVVELVAWGRARRETYEDTDDDAEQHRSASVSISPPNRALQSDQESSRDQ